MKVEPRVAFFPDSFAEVNGVTHTSRQFVAFAERRNLPLSLLEVARATPGAQAVTPVAQHVEFGGGNALGLRQVDGVDFGDFQRVTGVRVVEGRGLPPRGDVMIVDVKYAAARKTKLGDKIRWMDREFTVVGVYEPETGARMMIRFRRCRRRWARPGCARCSWSNARGRRSKRKSRAA
jgi:hypothetical protein